MTALASRDSRLALNVQVARTYGNANVQTANMATWHRDYKEVADPCPRVGGPKRWAGLSKELTSMARPMKARFLSPPTVLVVGVTHWLPTATSATASSS